MAMGSCWTWQWWTWCWAPRGELDHILASGECCSSQGDVDEHDGAERRLEGPVLGLVDDAVGAKLQRRDEHIYQRTQQCVHVLLRG